MMKRPLTAMLMLLIATVFWAVSFPAMKSLEMALQGPLPRASSWFVSSLTLASRFAFAAVILLILCRRVPRFTKLEIKQGAGLGFFNAFGLLLQMDGLAYTPASTSAFLTQCYCILIPIVVALHEKRWPPKKVIVSCALALAGVAVLARMDWRALRLGRGEIETILASVFFTGQILWLDRAEFSANQPVHTTLLMFVVTALLAVPVCVLTEPTLEPIAVAFAQASFWKLIVVLTILSTLLTYVAMNIWQPHLPATHAGLIYCGEPVFTSLFALFLPAFFSQWIGINYANESLTANLLLGGGLITLANILLLFGPAKFAESNGPGEISE